MKYLPISDNIERVKDGVIHIEFHDLCGVRISSGTGFLSYGLLITNDHVVDIDKASWVTLSHDNLNQTDLNIRMRYRDFLKHAKARSEKSQYDFAVFEIDELNSKNIYNFTFGDCGSV